MQHFRKVHARGYQMPFCIGNQSSIWQIARARPGSPHPHRRTGSGNTTPGRGLSIWVLERRTASFDTDTSPDTNLLKRSVFLLCCWRARLHPASRDLQLTELRRAWPSRLVGLEGGRGSCDIWISPISTRRGPRGHDVKDECQ